jgi:hypothetical protein
MTLSETWFMEGYIDFELQKYRLLAYLKEVKKYFNQTKLYPILADIAGHYNNLITFRSNKQKLKDAFPKNISKIDGDKMQLIYEQLLTDSALMQELDEITEYAAEQMKNTITEGAKIYEFIQKQLIIEPVGIMPLYKNEGYILLHCNAQREVWIYYYSTTLFENKDAKYRGLKMEFIDQRYKTPANTYEQIKLELIRDFRMLPNPAVYKVELPLNVPLNETLLPVTRRTFIKYLAIS